MGIQDTLDALPKPVVIEELDSAAIVARMAADAVLRFPDLDGIITLESEPSRALIEVAAYRETLIRARCNDVARADLLKFATGQDIDHLAAFYDVIRLAGELDEAFKKRTILEIEGRSPGGTVPRYRAVALGASVRVADAVVYRVGISPAVHVAVYATDNAGVADQALLNAVSTALNDPKVRMVSDTIIVTSAAFVTVPIAADIWLLPETSDAVADQLPGLLRAAWASETGLGFDLVREWITARLMLSGVQKAVVTAPSVDIVADPYQAIALGSITLTNRGRAY